MEINAVLGLSQLSNLTKWVNIRKDNFNKFLNIIKDIDYLDSNFTKEGNSSFCLPFVCDSPKNSQKLKSYLQNQGIETRPLCSGNLLRQPFLKEKNYPLPSNFPNSEKLHECGFYIGNNHMILDEDFDKLKVLLNNFNNE
jgi:CDP-6-deoxy-D-xylo-4-hexulose-3-dehydrase